MLANIYNQLYTLHCTNHILLTYGYAAISLIIAEQLNNTGFYIALFCFTCYFLN